MKNFVTLLFMVLSMSAAGQVNLDATYPNAGYNGGSMSWQALELVRLEVDGDKFLFRDNENKELKFYHLDHSFWKSISYSGATDVQPDFNNANALYISQHLFDLDDEIEFMYVDVFQNSGVTQIVNEDGSFLFTANDQAPRLLASVPQNQQPIYNTTSGTFMILSGTNSADGDAYVYTLQGTLSVGIAQDQQQFVDHGTAKAYPNPATHMARVDYRLPFGVYSGTIRLLDTRGNEVERVLVNSQSDHTMISTNGLSAGVYQYELSTSVGVLPCGKLVVE